MSLRRDVVDLLLADESTFRARAPDLLDACGLDGGRLDRPGETDLDGPVALDDLTGRERTLVRRVQALDDVPLGLTVSGPFYEDNPIVYANRTFRELSGYSLTELYGENPRLLQGPGTEPGPVDDLREALDIWEPVTVELRNYRRDGTPFRNRLTIVPVEGETGTVANWLGVQEAVD